MLTTTWLRLKALIHRRRLDRDLEDEMRFHLAMREQRCREAGASDPGNAARRRFGNPTSVGEKCRDMWTFAWIETVWQDIRYGSRQIPRSPGFSAVAILTIALGVGASTSVFSMFDTVMWRPIPLPDPERLVMVLQAMPGEPHYWTPSAPADIEDLGAATATLEGLASWSYGQTNLVEAGGEAVRVNRASVTPNLFDVLKVRPALGRPLQPDDDRVALISDGCWRRRYNGDPNIVGRAMRLDGRTYAVAGVMPREFAFPRVGYEVWTPLALTQEQRQSRKISLIDSVARLKTGRTREDAVAELNSIAARLEKLHPDTNKGRRFAAWPVQRYWFGDFAPKWAAMLLGATVFVLLIGALNIANLQLARATGRGREIAIRTSLGAARPRIFRQLVTEVLLLALGGAAVGLIASKWGLYMLKAGIPAEMRLQMPGWENIGLNLRALGYAFAIAMLSGIAAGLAPAWRCSRANLSEALKEGGQGASSARRRLRLRALFVAGEIALATVLLVGAGLMVRAFRASLSAGVSREPASLLTLRLALAEGKYSEPHQVAAYYRGVLERVAALPGVHSAATATGLPYSRRWVHQRFAIEGKTDGEPQAVIQAVSPGYFETLRIPLRAGRAITESDGGGVHVAVISERAAQRFWPGEPLPLGRRIRIGPPERQGPPTTIIGVVADIETSTLSRTPQPTVYVPFMQAPDRVMDLAVRTAQDPMELASAVRSAIRAADSEVPITNLNTLETLIRQEGFAFAYMAILMGLFGVLALALASLGVYGVVAYVVSEQAHDIGIRIALGAPRRRVLGMVFRRGMAAALVGLALGLLPAYGLARLMQAFVWGVTTSDPVTFLATPLALLGAAAVAVYVPARRAVRIDPVVALRAE